MEQERRRRSTGKVDRLPPELKDTVEQMLLTGCTYKEIVAFLKANGEEMSQMAICTYARKYLATVEMINVAQSNFSMLMDEMNRYPDLDTSEALIRLASHHVLNALSGKIFSLTCLMKTMRKMHESSLKRTGERCWLGQKFSGRKSSLTMT